MRTQLKLFLIGIFIFAVSACTRNPFEVIVINCPAVAVVENAGVITLFSGEGRDTEDVALDASISGISTNCEEDTGIDHQVSFDIIARRGPAMSEDSVTLRYFVALMKDNYQIVSKRVFETTIRFAPGATRAGVHETIRQTFDDIDVARRYDYELLVGFQLSPDQAAYNALR